MRAAVERGLDLSRSHCEETSFQWEGPHLLKMHTRLLPSHRGFPGQSSGQMRQLAKAVDVEMEKTRGFQLYFHSPTMKNHQKIIMMINVSPAPLLTKRKHLSLSGLSWVPTVTKQPGNSFNSVKKENQLV